MQNLWAKSFVARFHTSYQNWILPVVQSQVRSSIADSKHAVYAVPRSITTLYAVQRYNSVAAAYHRTLQGNVQFVEIRCHWKAHAYLHREREKEKIKDRKRESFYCRQCRQQRTYGHVSVWAWVNTTRMLCNWVKRDEAHIRQRQTSRHERNKITDLVDASTLMRAVAHSSSVPYPAQQKHIFKCRVHCFVSLNLHNYLVCLCQRLQHGKKSLLFAVSEISVDLHSYCCICGIVK